MREILLTACILGGLYYVSAPPAPAESPASIPTPAPVTPAAPIEGGKAIVGGREYEGQEITADLPESEHIKNRGGSDGAGMCVMSSIEMAARYAGLEQMRGLRDWCARQPGGAYPGKVDKQLKEYCAEKNIPVPPYVQYEGKDVESVLKLIDKTRRMACITYGVGERYNGQTIAHMVCSPRYRGSFGVVLDNNFPKTYEWMNSEELARRIKHPSGQGWIFVWLEPAPPEAPFN